MIRSILIKQFIHIRKDPQSLVLIFLLPMLMLLLFGYAITFEMKDIHINISDFSNTPQSRFLIEKIAANGFFKVYMQNITESEIDTVFKNREALMVLIIPSGFTRDLRNGNASVQALIDAGDPNSAQFSLNYLQSVISKVNFDLGQPITLINVQPRLFYNQLLKSSYYFVPGLVAIILLLLSALLTSLAIVKEKETGTIEQLLVSPITSSKIVIGKLIPYLIISFFSGCMILFTAIFLFHIPNYGSLVLILFLMLLYIGTGLSLGLLISTITNSQHIAMMIAMITTILPTILLSGFVFPIKSMPLIFQWISFILPPTHFLIIIRGIMLKGIGFFELLPHILILFLIFCGLLFISIKKFSLRLE
ncbi:MAG: ABC transporter permease [Candidatus Margulisiibacteriota bacterium]|jgi:ABC-2 type transport system permease protein